MTFFEQLSEPSREWLFTAMEEKMNKMQMKTRELLGFVSNKIL